MSNHPLTIILSIALVAVPACVSAEAHRELQAANEKLQLQMEDLKGHQQGLDQLNQKLRGQVDELGRNAVDASLLKERRAELEALIAQFEQGGTRAIPGVKAFETAEGLVFQLQGEILFESGQAQITESGKAVLRKLVPDIHNHPNAVRVDGHTDSDPIVRSAWKTNLRLSAERAMAVVDFLGKNGLDGDRMHAAAFGEHKPAAVGDSAEAKRQNRRVEILMLRK